MRFLVGRIRCFRTPAHRSASGGYAVWHGPESDLRLGDEGLAVRMVPFDEVLDLKVPPYMHHYLPLLIAANGQSTGRTS
ncbi:MULTISPECIES: hypothetical protein [unclassified Kitasatospora]|uniref:hypothetical protein n=1 Tax=unclassified Kitasatospora TaxID=2633591 RepID=UPI0033D75A03